MRNITFLLCLFLVGCGKPGPQGTPGTVGAQGPQGVRGETGAAGADGVNGLDAALPPYSVVSILDPCGDAPGIVDEVLLKLANGQVLVSFSDNSSGKNTRFSILSPGTFITTDGSSCVFTLDAHGDIH